MCSCQRRLEQRVKRCVCNVTHECTRLKLVSRGGRGTQPHIHCIHYVFSIILVSSFLSLLAPFFSFICGIDKRSQLLRFLNCQFAFCSEPLSVSCRCRLLRRPHVLHAHTVMPSVCLGLFCSDTRARYPPRTAAAMFDEKKKLLLFLRSI